MRRISSLSNTSVHAHQIKLHARGALNAALRAQFKAAQAREGHFSMLCVRSVWHQQRQQYTCFICHFAMRECGAQLKEPHNYVAHLCVLRASEQNYWL